MRIHLKTSTRMATVEFDLQDVAIEKQKGRERLGFGCATRPQRDEILARQPRGLDGLS